MSGFLVRNSGNILESQQFNDQLTDEQQTIRAQGATAGTFTLTFNGETTAPIAFNANAAAVDAALEALPNIEHLQLDCPLFREVAVRPQERKP